MLWGSIYIKKDFSLCLKWNDMVGTVYCFEFSSRSNDWVGVINFPFGVRILTVLTIPSSPI